MALRLESTSTLELSKALFNAKKDFKKLVLDGSNNGKKYATNKSIWASIKDALGKHQIGLEDEFDYTYSCQGELTEFYILKLVHLESGEFRRHPGAIIPMVPQGFDKDGNPRTMEPNMLWGGGVTYKRRKILETVMGLLQEDNVQSNSYDSSYQQKENCISEKQCGLLRMKLKGNASFEKKLVETYGALNEIPWRDFNKIIERLKNL